MRRIAGSRSESSRIRSTIRMILTGAALCTVLLAANYGPVQAAEAPVDTLILVNGEAITSADMDQMIMAAHSSMTMDDQAGGRLTRLLEKRVNDLLILQDAVGMGMDEDEGFLEVLNEKHDDFTIQKYLQENYVRPVEVHSDSTRAFFERFYWKIQIRQLSVRTLEQAEEMRDAVLAGTSMDTLAQVVSLDTRKLNGGLHNLVYWADVENVFRDQVRDLDPGQISAIFPYRDSFSFIRVERRLPLNEADYAKFEVSIRAAVLGQLREQHRDAFFDQLQSQVTIREDADVVATILADSSLVLDGLFRKHDPAIAIEVSGGPVLTAGKFREAISHETMQDGTAPFIKNLEKARRVALRKMVLVHAANRQGYFERADVVARYNTDWEEGLLQGYLAETITDRIVFSRDEFNEYYEQNKERFRGPSEVRLDILILQDEAKIREAAQRLADGADFGFVWQQYQRAETGTPGKAAFVKETLLSKDIRDQLTGMKAGDASEVLDMPMGYMVFVLDERREGSVPTVQDMDMGIRQTLFEKEFKKLLDDHLGLLKERSEIVRRADKIEAYFNPDGEGK